MKLNSLIFLVFLTFPGCMNRSLNPFKGTKGLSIGKSEEKSNNNDSQKGEGALDSAKLLLSDFCKDKNLANSSDESAAKQLALANNEFAINLYQELIKKNGNFVASPLSISLAMGMTLAGAAGETADEIKTALKFSLSDEKLHQGFSDLLSKAMCQTGAAFEIKMANAVWGQSDYPFKKDYFDLLKKYYLALATSVDFINKSSEARETINKWISEGTNEKIKEILKEDSLTKMTRLVLTNTLYFKAPWLRQFSSGKTTKEDFFVSPEKNISTEMMHKKDNQYYYEDEEIQALDLGFLSKEKSQAVKFSLVIILPKKQDGLDDFEKSLDNKKYQVIVEKLYKSTASVDAAIPKFKIETASDLKELLQEMGLKKAFTDKAEFSGMQENGKNELYLDKILHNTFLDVNENGAEAAAATAVVASYKTSPPRESVIFRADHPFIFAIISREDNGMLFLGRFKG